MAIPIARKHAAASKGATGPRLTLSTRKLPNSPEMIATRPFPRNMALEKVKDSHCCSNPLWNQMSTNYLLIIHHIFFFFFKKIKQNYLVVFSNEPRFKRRKQERSSNTTQDTTQQQNLVLRRMLGHAAQYVSNAVCHTCPLSTPVISVANKL